MDYTYTIIIPHKNAPLLLQRCLDSIPFRDDIQIIVVDDDSSSDVVDFMDFPGSSREDVEIIFTKEGKGAGYAVIVACFMLEASGCCLLMLMIFFCPVF